MHSVAAVNARAGSSAAATPAGLVRRVPGAQRPDAALAVRAPQPEAAEPARSSPDDVYSFLSSFQSGVARGRADAAPDPSTDSHEEPR